MGSSFVTFQEAAKLVRQSVNPEDVGDMPYVGLEHIEEGTLRLIGIGNPKSVKSTKFKFSKGDILFGKLRPYFRKVIRPDFDGVCSTDIWVVRAKQGIDQGYLYYWMASNDFVNFATQGSEGTKMPRAKWEHVGRFQRQRFEESEQRAIAHILGSLDDKIELNRRMNNTLEAMARAIFKSWFVDFDPVVWKAVQANNPVPERFSETAARYQNGAPCPVPDHIAALFPGSFEDSELGEIPKGWEVKSLDQIADYMNGLACQKYPPEEGKISFPVIKIRELRQGISENTDKATSDVPASYIVEDGDVLFSWSGSLLIDIWTQGKGVLNQHLFKITSENYPKWFYYYWTDHHLKEFQRIAAYKATTMGHIKRHHLADAKSCVAYSDVMKFADEEIAPLFMLRIQNELEVKKLASLRDTLLPKLISGELRIQDVEKFIEDELE